MDALVRAKPCLNLAPYIACEDMDFVWKLEDVLDVECMWRRGVPIGEIAEYVDRDSDEVLILLIDRAREGRIEARKGGIWGGQ